MNDAKHPRDFGAAWDGVTDDTDAVNAWIAYMHGIGRKAVFPPGKAYLAGTLNCVGNISSAPGCVLRSDANPTIRMGAEP
jgi:polygalacturonase